MYLGKDYTWNMWRLIENMRFESYLKAFCKLNLKNTIVCNFLLITFFQFDLQEKQF